MRSNLTQFRRDDLTTNILQNFRAAAKESITCDKLCDRIQHSETSRHFRLKQRQSVNTANILESNGYMTAECKRIISMLFYSPSLHMVNRLLSSIIYIKISTSLTCFAFQNHFWKWLKNLIISCKFYSITLERWNFAGIVCSKLLCS
jgi:hypothetical protein